MTAWVLIALFWIAGLQSESESLAPDDCIRLANRVKPSLVDVEYTLQYDQGEKPTGYRYHGFGRHDFESLIAHERPAALSGFLIAEQEVVALDLQIHPRFIKDITVRFGDHTTAASITAVALDQNAVFLRLAQPLPGTRPLVFDAGASDPYVSVSRSLMFGTWRTDVDPWSRRYLETSAGERLLRAGANTLITDRLGTPVGVTMNAYVPADEEWRGSPADWAKLTLAELDDHLSRIESTADQCVLRAALSFRSPKDSAGGEPFRWSFDEKEEDSTERNVAALLLDESTALVLAELKPDVTARLERIRVFPTDGEPVPAAFAHTLRHYGAFVATLDTPLPGPVRVSKKPILTLRDQLQIGARIRLQGEKRVAHYGRQRVQQYAAGWRSQTYPGLGTNDEENIYLFDLDGALIAFPISRRRAVSDDSRWARDDWTLTAASYVGQLFDDLSAHVDPSNVPLLEEQENRLAWMGVELQGLDRELARINGVSHLTRDGQTGALVSYVYPDSPAAAAGIEPGNILLRLRVEGEPKPVAVEADGDGFGFDSLMFDMLDDLPEDFFSNLPPPWPSVNNKLNKALVRIGFGKRYKAELFRGGDVVLRDMQVEESPPHFDSAPRFKSERLGMTVRDLTYEVRRHFLKRPDDPGVIVSKVEPGEKAAVAGIKPYEIITHVNDQPVTGVDAFREQTKQSTQLRLTVNRMAKNRLVRIALPEE